ncbi:MAG: prepilin-type N-terminal cleavage/methylation domain-containing protein [Planctomycetes bacterium]|nr:prepilin-type N-terminal cleavage/methylation domain-containing protein [Planctomycetota bacterium]
MRSTPHKTTRHAFTLLELMLVLAILVGIAALVIPSFQGTLKTQRLKGGADVVRGAWGEARVEAMRTGGIVVFEFELEGNRFRVSSMASAFSAFANPALGIGQSNTMPPPNMMFDGGYEVLPEGIRFQGQMSEVDTREADVGGAVPVLAGGLRRVYFYPDGTTTTTRVRVADERGMYLDIDLRGLTGIAQVSEVHSGNRGT